MKKQMLKPWQYILLVVVSIISFQLVQTNPPSFFDKFGVISFAFLLGLSIWMLKTKKETPDNLAFWTLFIAIQGLIIDGVIVFGGIR